MDIRMNISQSSNLSQQLNLAPQLLQWLKILQTPSAQLQEIVRSELEHNPALEIDEIEGAPASLDAAALPEETNFSESDFGERMEVLASIDDDWRAEGNRASSSDSYSDDEEKHDFMMNSATEGKTLCQHLTDQLGLLDLNETETACAASIIGCLNSKGYLSVPLDELAKETGVSTEYIERVLHVVQQLEPAGAAARNLRECLLLQLEDKEENRTAIQVAEGYLEQLARGLHAEIARELGVSKEEVQAAHSIISSLNPHPGLAFSEQAPEYVEADVEIAEEADGSYRISLMDQRIPRLRISAACRALMEKKNLTQEEVNYLKNRIRAASFLIEGIHQREETLRKVTEHIISLQKDFFTNKAGELRPLTMAKIGSMLKIHETTVSRAIANKYVRTPRGMFPMRSFFVQGYRCADGSALTPEAVKKIIQDMVRAENRERPLRDIDIAAALKQRGLKVARRTIAKYREETGIPSSKERCTATERRTAGPMVAADEEIHLNAPVFAVA